MPPSYNLGPELAGCGSPPSLKQPSHSLGVPLRFTDLPCRLAGAPTDWSLPRLPTEHTLPNCPLCCVLRHYCTAPIDYLL